MGSYEKSSCSCFCVGSCLGTLVLLKSFLHQLWKLVVGCIEPQGEADAFGEVARGDALGDIIVGLEKGYGAGQGAFCLG